MPKFSSRVLRLIASDWQVSPLLSIRSAQMFTVTSGLDSALSGIQPQRPNYSGSPVYPASQSFNNWMSRAAFAQPAPGTYGNVGVSQQKGPGLFQLDLALSRSFPLHER